MPEGGASLFCAAQRAAFQGPRGIAFRAVRPAFELAEGGRYTTFFARDHPIPLVSNEAIQRYDESEYSSPILGNTISFEQAALESAAVDPWQLEARWREAWNALSI